jgi:hypothetical protein
MLLSGLGDERGKLSAVFTRGFAAWFVMHGGEAHFARCRSFGGREIGSTPLDAASGCPLQMQLDDGLGGFRRHTIHAGHARPAFGIGGAIGGILGLRTGHGQAGVEILRCGIELHPLAMGILPKKAHEAALAQVGDAGGLPLHLEAIKRAALHREALLKPAIETFTLIVGDDERVFSTAAELRADFIAWAFGGPAVEIGGRWKT